MTSDMDEALKAWQDYQDAQRERRIVLARSRARLGLALIQARDRPGCSQVTSAAALGKSIQQVQSYERAYRAWAREHPDQEP